jgi:hypothetical protein
MKSPSIGVVDEVKLVRDAGGGVDIGKLLGN